MKEPESLHHVGKFIRQAAVHSPGGITVGVQIPAGIAVSIAADLTAVCAGTVR